ncbi:MAG TPA: divalent-cation tolerance protein CutA, partial [Vicinamibacterales bacterium]|nr:divalent-cation tolerance protein CutA [Vicinamibacterales bacterium]
YIGKAMESAPITRDDLDASAVVVVLTTLPAGADALAFARAVVDERLAACVGVLSEMQSVYRWQGAVEHAPERQLVIKTTRGQVARLTDWLAAHHPYEVPELIVMPADGGDAYLAWVRQSTAG